ncbi:MULTISPECIES: formyltetrahydrofolate deformylase [Rhodococcus]|uniref:Formyltetrahydrofolate deformylase n=1 Tax=Rhodococcus jostii TaxID=132919 RepID=A0ABU4CR51_RHOJO|nr:MULTISPECIES: formyltetrahydrofolate deformylase [Rhodococcus]NHU42264.1 formyltetrahydrofolate deformylase [Rhodococcus sp. A14]MDI9978196.1 formyltetrahydrofolate deformylase [Rhodococcus sp. IEGM 1307]MDV6286046.1 formyltetrahydrofolate deformylase [Rhodococcus jostii]PBC51832.1 formyltetrahydrofolate deformylase [Rhodococcus sp. ACPA1]QSE86463.1 formyltetrahydrofolate deformylase [Rhodococcus koreensis]
MSRTSRDVVDLGTLIVQGDDRQGIVAAVSSLLAKYGANIVSLDQHSTDPAGGRFFQRTTFHLEDLPAQIPSLSDELDNVLGMLGQSYRLTEARKPKRVAIMVSKTDHCLLDLLWRQRRGEIHMNVGMVIANHPDLGDDVRGFGIPFIHIPVNRASRAQAEAEQLKLLTDNVDLVVLARYMQILSGDFLQQVGVPVINIHHSFLPAFIGAGPYQKAKDRGVKLIGATAHYVTEDLDEGPIIEQDVVRVSHVETAAELQRRGADVERQVLSRAVAWHCEDRVIRDGNQTVVF